MCLENAARLRFIYIKPNHFTNIESVSCYRFSWLAPFKNFLEQTTVFVGALLLWMLIRKCNKYDELSMRQRQIWQEFLLFFCSETSSRLYYDVTYRITITARIFSINNNFTIKRIFSVKMSTTASEWERKRTISPARIAEQVFFLLHVPTVGGKAYWFLSTRHKITLIRHNNKWVSGSGSTSNWFADKP